MKIIQNIDLFKLLFILTLALRFVMQFTAGALIINYGEPLYATPLELPDLGSSAESLLSNEAEQRLGQAFMRKLRESLPVLNDSLVTNYLESVGRTLVAADSDRQGEFTFFVIDQPVVNAFAGPGGFIGVYAGLLLATETESELAAVLAHEIAHVTQRHLLRSIEDQQKLVLPTAALLVAAAILGAQVSSDAGAAAIAGIQAAALQHQINFTRENEQEADRLGIRTLKRAGYDPYAMAGFFERLARTSRIYDNQAPEFLRTHPVNSNRIAEALARADEGGVHQHPDSLRFLLTRVALRERAEKHPEAAVAHFRDTLRSGRYPNETAEHYGYARALLRHGQLAEAQSEASKLLAMQPNIPEFIVLNSLIIFKQKHPEEALKMLRQAIDLFPDLWPIRLTYAEILSNTGQSVKALEELRRVARQRPHDTTLYDPLEQTAIKAGNQTETQRIRAERLYAEGDRSAAIHQLEIALRMQKFSYHDAAQLQSLLETWRVEEREQQQQEHKKSSKKPAGNFNVN